MDRNTTGTVALVGSGEFLPPIDDLDRGLLARLADPPRAVILPTASAPDGPGVPERWARQGIEHFTRLGATSSAVMVRTRADAESADLAAEIATANLVYLSGGKPQYLYDTLRDTACWRAIAGVFAAGGVIAGCSAGAMALGARMVAWPRLWQTQPALGLAPGLVVIPHFDEMPGWMAGAVRRLPRDGWVVGVEGSTALVGNAGTWRVEGRGRVTVFGDGTPRVYEAGESVPLARA